jgi:hypothetical protein
VTTNRITGQLTLGHGDLYSGSVEVIKREEFARQSND